MQWEGANWVEGNGGEGIEKDGAAASGVRRPKARVALGRVFFNLRGLVRLSSKLPFTALLFEILL